MEAFEYASPTTLKEAVGLLGSDRKEAEVLAGGTDLITLMKDYVVSPKRVVNLKNIKELGGVHKAGSNVRLGATVTSDELASNAIIRAEFPSLVMAANGITSPQLRNMGTIGGDLCQRPRCWYYRLGYGILAMKDGKSLVPNGENRYHAIFGGGPAYFVSASSYGPALIALGAKVKVTSKSGSRELEVEKLFVAPQTESEYQVSLKPDEIITEILIPSAHGAKNATYEVRHREAIADWPLATASVVLHMNGSTISHARVVMGHVAPTPWVAASAEKMLAGKSIDESVAEDAGKAAVEGAQPLSQNSYKVQLAKVAVKRALLAAAGKAA